MGVAPEDDVDSCDPPRELEVDVHAVVREQRHDLGAFAPRFVHGALQAPLLDAELPVGDETARMGDRRVRERLADHGNRNAAQAADRVRLEHRVAEIAGLDVLREELDPPRKIPFDDFLDARGAVGELPMSGRDIHAEQLLRLDHVLPSRPQRGRRSLPGVAAVEQEARAALCAQLLDERGKMGEAAHFSVPLRRSRKIEVSKGVRFAAARPDSIAPEKGSTDQMRRKVAALPGAEIASPRRPHRLGEADHANAVAHLERERRTVVHHRYLQTVRRVIKAGNCFQALDHTHRVREVR